MHTIVRRGAVNRRAGAARLPVDAGLSSALRRIRENHWEERDEYG
jgi:hypothetical protein